MLRKVPPEHMMYYKIQHSSGGVVGLRASSYDATRRHTCHHMVIQSPNDPRCHVHLQSQREDLDWVAACQAGLNQFDDIYGMIEFLFLPPTDATSACLTLQPEPKETCHLAHTGIIEFL